MKLQDALLMLDKPEEGGHHILFASSRKRNECLFISGVPAKIMKCTRDWPQEYDIIAEDLKVDDWQVIDDISKSGTYDPT